MNRFIQKLIAVVAAVAALRLIILSGAPDRALNALRSLGRNENFTAALLGVEPDAAREGSGTASAVVSHESSAPAPVSVKALSLQSAPPQSQTVPSEAAPRAPSELEIKNTTSYVINTEELLSEPLSYTLSSDSPQVLILHTHGSEAYSQSGGESEESDHSRTEDRSKNVVRVGDVLGETLTARGLTVLHDTELYDYPSYSGSYARSLASVENYLERYPDLKVVIDLHRDSASDPSGSAYRTEYVAPGGVISSQLMIIAATGESGLSFPNWRENMKLALRLQADLGEKYPGLARPLLVSTERYNQHAAPGYLLVEIGTDGNTLAEAENAARLFADCLADVLTELIR